MTLEEAEDITRQYGGVLADEDVKGGPASFESKLQHPRATIVQAMKLMLAYQHQHGRLTDEFRNEIGTVACRLPLFIPDDEARRLNQLVRNVSREQLAKLPPGEFAQQSLKAMEAHDWSTKAHTEGWAIRGELSDFVADIERFNPDDALYWQRVYTLVGLEYPPKKKRGVFDLFG